MKSILNPVLKVALEKKNATPSQKATLSGTAANRGIGWIFGIKSIKICKKIHFLESQFNHLDLTHPRVHDELESDDGGGAEVGEDVAVGEEDGGVELEDELAKDRRDDGANEEAADMEKIPGVHQEVDH